MVRPATALALVTAMVVVGWGGCGGDDGNAMTDAPADDGDAPPIDAPDDCDPTTIYFAGELLDWDSTSANRRGIGDVTVAQRSDTAKTSTTMSDGTFELCIANDALVFVDMTPPNGSGTVRGLALVSKDVLTSGGAYSVRAFQEARAISEYAFDATKAHVYVRVNLQPRLVGVAASFTNSYVFSGSEWLAGENTGQDVYFANVDPTDGETKVIVERAAGVPTNIPLEAGKLTYVVVNATN